MPVRKIKSTRELARAIGGISQTAICKWLKHENWSFGRGPWATDQIPKIRKWAEKTLSPNPAARESRNRSAEQSPTNFLKLIKGQREALAYKRDLNELHRVDECELRRVRQLQIMKNRLLGEIDGLPEPLTRESIRSWIETILTEWSHGGDRV